MVLSDVQPPHSAEEPGAARGLRTITPAVGVGGVSRLRVLVACECSGVVRDAFAALGHDAWSCDIVPSERPGNHLQRSVLDVKVVKGGWDLMIAHPDCTFLAVSGARWMSEEWREEAQLAALHFVKALWKFPVPRIAIENPVGKLPSLWRGATQYIQPWQFGHGEVKNTGLWLKGLPPLAPTHIVEGREARVFEMAPSETRKRDRSRTYEGIAQAMARQWGGGGGLETVRLQVAAAVGGPGNLERGARRNERGSQVAPCRASNESPQ